MKREVWGPYIWTVLHCLTLRIKDEQFEKERKTIMEFISEICDNLPCPNCAGHATFTLRKLNFMKIRTKEELINVIFKLHNEVNRRLKKKIFERSSLEETYKKYNLQSLLIGYFKINQEIRYAEKMMLYSSRRTIFFKRFLNYCKNNMDKFNVVLEN